MAMAVSSLFHKEIERIILVRPLSKRVKKLGFSTGDLQRKVNPYLRRCMTRCMIRLEFERAQS